MWRRRLAVGWTVIALLALAGCGGGGGGSGGNASSDISGSSSVVGISSDPSIPTFSGAPEDQSFINAALAGAGMSLTPPAATETVYVAPPTSYTPSGATQIGNGTQASPYQNLIAVVDSAVPGEHIYLEPGTYEMYNMAQAFGLAQSWLVPTTAGTQADPIVIETDPAALSWPNKLVATLDFQLMPAAPSTSRSMAIDLPDWWDFDNIEVKNALDRIFWVDSAHDLIYHNDLHHVQLTETQDNVGIVDIMRRGGGDYEDFIIGNNIHDFNPDGASGPLGQTINEGCTYSETNQYYTTYSNLSASGIANVNSLTQSQLATYTTAPDNNVYFYANLLHNCQDGIGTKIPEFGPWYVLSNMIYGVQNGIKFTMSGTVGNPSLVRNNIIYNAPVSGGYQLQNGMIIGWPMTDRNLGNADNMTITNNTIINANNADTALYGGFNDVIDNNVFVTTSSGYAHYVYGGGYSGGSGIGNGSGVNSAGQYFDGGGVWPGVEGEYLFPVNSTNPYYASMPDYLQETGWGAETFSGNLYVSTPIVHFAGTPAGISPNLNGTDIDTNATVMSWANLSPLFRDASTDDFRAGTSPGILATVGSQIP